jgi:staphylococcal nuclease domain-containing protein 1
MMTRLIYLYNFFRPPHFRLESKSNPVDEPGAFPAREWLRNAVVGKQVRFETRKQGASAGERVYGWLFIQEAGSEEPLHLAVECVRQGHATPKAIRFPSKTDDAAGDAATDPAAAEETYESLLMKAYNEAKEAGRGIHATATTPLVRSLRNAGTDFAALALVENCQKIADQKRITCVIEYVFDGSRMRCLVTDPNSEFQYSTFTLLLAGVMCPRIGNAKVDPPFPSEPFSEEARQFVQSRLLQRELQVSLLGTDKSGGSAVGTIHHPAGNIAVELLKIGLARMADWSVRLMPAGEVPSLRVAENGAKRTLKGVWHSYAAPVLMNASETQGTVIEVQSGDTVVVLPDGKAYDTEDILLKVSLASIRAPRAGSEAAHRPDEPYALECKEKLRAMVIGKSVKVQIHYERDIPIRPDVTEKRPFGTLSVGKHEDISLVLVSEGLAVTQRHRDDDERSPRYDELLAAEAVAKAAKKGVHKEGDYKRGAINDLTEPRKAKAYSGSLMRAGSVKAVVDYVFNGALFKLYIPSENCYIRFAPNYIRCPQPSGNPGSRQQRPSEPFGDESKRHARMNCSQRQVEINCSGVTNSGIILGTMKVAQNDYSIELLGSGLATVDQHKIDFGEAPKHLIDAQVAAKENRVGIWSIEQPTMQVVAKTTEKAKEALLKIRLCEIRSGNHFYYQLANDGAVKVMEDSMKLFTKNHGTAGAPCDVKLGKVVAALFDDGTGKVWYRAKITERKGPGKVAVLFLDFGNVAVVPVATHLRPLDMSLGTDRIPPVAKEAVLALISTRSLQSDEGVDAARMLQSLCWGKDLTARFFAPDELGKQAVALITDASDETVNSQLVTEGLARVSKQASVDVLVGGMTDGNSVVILAAELNVAQEAARKTRSGMWRYGDVGDDDPDAI